jgi:hypothetical protein
MVVPWLADPGLSGRVGADAAMPAAHASGYDGEYLTRVTLEGQAQKAYDRPDDDDGHDGAEWASRRVKVGECLHATAEEEHGHQEAIDSGGSSEDDHRLREKDHAALEESLRPGLTFSRLLSQAPAR